MFVRHLRALKLRKPHRLRSIPQGHDDEDHTEYSDSGRNPEGPLPGPDVLQSGIDIGLGRGRIHRRGDVRRVLGDTCADLSVSAHVHSGVPHDVAAKHGDEESSDRMRGVPDGHLGSELVRWYPVGYQTVARRESASLEHIVDNVKHSEQDDKVIDKLRPVVRPDKVGADHRARSEQDVHERADGQSGDKMPAAVETVGQKAVYQLGHAIHETCDGEDSSERGLGDAIFSGQTRNGERKVLTYKIENRVADHRSDDCAPLPILETFFLFLCHHITESRLLRNSDKDSLFRPIIEYLRKIPTFAAISHNTGAAFSSPQATVTRAGQGSHINERILWTSRQKRSITTGSGAL